MVYPWSLLPSVAEAEHGAGNRPANEQRRIISKSHLRDGTWVYKVLCLPAGFTRVEELRCACC